MTVHQARTVGIGLAAAAAAALFAPPTASAAAIPRHSGHSHGTSVFVQSDDTTANGVVAYHRAADGGLTRRGVYGTGGRGGVLDGSAVDHLASQGSLAYDRHEGLLYAVNAGSDTLTVFAVDGDRLERLQIIPTGGDFPVSVTFHDNRVYVLNALDGGSVQGFVRIGHRLAGVDSWLADRDRVGHGAGRGRRRRHRGGLSNRLNDPSDRRNSAPGPRLVSRTRTPEPLDGASRITGASLPPFAFAGRAGAGFFR